jgi:hypothetical protein
MAGGSGLAVTGIRVVVAVAGVLALVALQARDTSSSTTQIIHTGFIAPLFYKFAFTHQHLVYG